MVVICITRFNNQKSCCCPQSARARTHTHTCVYVLCWSQNITTSFYSPDGYVFITAMKCFSAWVELNPSRNSGLYQSLRGLTDIGFIDCTVLYHLNGRYYLSSFGHCVRNTEDQQHWKWCSAWSSKQNLSGRSLLSKRHKFSSGTCVRVILSFAIKIMISPVAIFTEYTSTKQHYVEIPYTKFHINWTINVEVTGSYSLTILGKVPILLLPTFPQLTLPQ